MGIIMITIKSIPKHLLNDYRITLHHSLTDIQRYVWVDTVMLLQNKGISKHELCLWDNYFPNRGDDLMIWVFFSWHTFTSSGISAWSSPIMHLPWDQCKLATFTNDLWNIRENIWWVTIFRTLFVSFLCEIMSASAWDCFHAVTTKSNHCGCVLHFKNFQSSWYLQVVFPSQPK